MRRYMPVFFISVLALGLGCQKSGIASNGDSMEQASDAGVSPDDTDPDSPDNDETSEIFDQDTIKKYYLTMAEEDWDYLTYNGYEKVYVPASLEVDGQTWGEIGVRHKGSYSLDSCYPGWWTRTREFEGHCQKLSLKLKFNEYDPDLRYYGVKRLNLHSGSADPTQMHDRLAYAIYREMGVIASRSMYAEVYMNGEYLGLFQAVENVDGRFTKNRFPEAGDGNLFKEVWPYEHDDEENIMEALRTNDDPEDDPDVSDFMAFRAAVMETGDSDVEERLLPWIDPEQIVRMLAVDRAIHNWDGPLAFYGGTMNHNYYWYHKENDKFLLIPWDMDKTFWEYDRYFYPDPEEGVDAIPGWNVNPASCEVLEFHESIGPPEEGPAHFGLLPPGCDNLFHTLAANYFEAFEAFGRELLDGPFALENLNDKLDTWEAQIDPIMRDEPTITYREWQDAMKELRETLPKLRSHFQSHLDEGYRDE